MNPKHNEPVWLWLATGLLGAGCFGGPAQSVAEPGAAEQRCEFVCRAWRVEDGLPLNSVMTIAQTRDGYIWLGTANGLARFDGVRFKRFGLPEGLSSLHVRVLLEYREGGLWIGTANGLNRYRDGHFTSWTARDGLAGDPNFQMSGTGAADQAYRILATTNVADPWANWIEVGRGTFAGGVFSFTDPGSTNYPRRFYRVVMP